MKRLLLSVLLVLGSALPVAAQNPVSVAQLGTTAIDTNSGNKSNGTQRVVLATDQPTPTNPFNVAQSGNWLVQGLVAHDAAYSGNPLPTGCYASASAPAAVADGDMVRMWCLTNGAVSVNVTNATLTLAANQSVNVAQVGGNNTSTGNGASGTGVQRVTIANDSTGVVGLNTGSNLVGYVGRKPTYGAKTTITWTGTSLGNGNGRESTAIDWTSTRCYDGRIRVQTKGQASGTAYLDWYVYTALGDTTYTDLATGTDAAFTAANRFNSRYLGSIRMNANTSAVIGEFQLSDIFGSMPDKWGLIGINNSGAALSATAGDHVIEYECVN